MDKVIENIKAIAMRYPAVNKVLLFGSRARGDHQERSDYDIAVISPELTLEQKNKFSDEIEEMDTFHKIDLVFLKGLDDKKPFHSNIKKDGIVIMDKFQSKLNNYKNALARLHESVNDYNSNPNQTMRDGVIQRFEFTTELSWKMIREYLISLQIPKINNPKAVMAEAYNNDIITKEDEWIQVLKDRNATSHIYDETEADEIFDRITEKHIYLFDELLEYFSKANTYSE